MAKLSKHFLTHFDFIQPMLIVPIIFASFLLVSEANEILAHKQIMYFVVGVFVFFISFLFPIRKLSWLIPFVYWITIALLILVIVIGSDKGMGARRWIEFPFTHFTIQPSEFIKPTLILMLAYLIKHDPPTEKGYGFKKFIKLSFFILLPFVLIAKEPDLGTALIVLFVGYALLFLVGVNYKIWLSLALLVAVLAPLAYNTVVKDYQKKRINDFLSDEPSYHVKQSIIAIGSGGILGKDKEEATQTHFKFLPISTSDFIFAYTIERYGFLGGMALIICYTALIFHLLSLNIKLRSDYFARVFISGVAFLIFLYVGVNISMTIGYAPVVGVPLPFYSYGGSSFVTFMCLFGITQNLLTFRFSQNYKISDSAKYIVE